MIYQQLKDANIAALKNHDVNARSVLSVLLNKIKLAEIEKRTQNAPLTDADVVAVLQKTLKELAEGGLSKSQPCGKRACVGGTNCIFVRLSSQDDDCGGNKGGNTHAGRQVGSLCHETLQGKFCRQMRYA